MTYQDLWPLIQRDIYGVLCADELIGTRKGVLLEPGDVESIVESKVAAALGVGKDGKPGVGFLVLPIEKAEDPHGSNPQGPLKLTLSVQFVENVTLNRGLRGTGLPLRIWAARAEKLLKLYTPVQLTANLAPANPVITEFTPDRDANLRVCQVEFTAFEADSAPTLKLNRPAITISGSDYPYTATVTLAGADAIYWTTDGSHPWEGNPTATLYNGPVSITEVCLFRARAFKSGYFASDTAATNFE